MMERGAARVELGSSAEVIVCHLKGCEATFQGSSFESDRKVQPSVGIAAFCHHWCSLLSLKLGLLHIGV